MEQLTQGAEPAMRMSEREETWVVYRAVVGGEATGSLAVCGQWEREEYELVSPGQRSLVEGGIESEGVAERMARRTAGDAKPR
jgi:hypothetical protein